MATSQARDHLHIGLGGLAELSGAAMSNLPPNTAPPRIESEEAHARRDGVASESWCRLSDASESGYERNPAAMEGANGSATRTHARTDMCNGCTSVDGARAFPSQFRDSAYAGLPTVLERGSYGSASSSVAWGKPSHGEKSDEELAVVAIAVQHRACAREGKEATAPYQVLHGYATPNLSSGKTSNPAGCDMSAVGESERSTNTSVTEQVLLSVGATMSLQGRGIECGSGGIANSATLHSACGCADTAGGPFSKPLSAVPPMMEPFESAVDVAVPGPSVNIDVASEDEKTKNIIRYEESRPILFIEVIKGIATAIGLMARYGWSLLSAPATGKQISAPKDQPQVWPRCL